MTARAIHTPGHRPEHCCFLVAGTLFTGDSLFVGTVARPDLAVEAREGAEGMFRSLHRLLELADDVQVFPGHVAGSLCGTGMSPAPSTTIGAERLGNPLLAIATVADFVDETAEAATPRPPNMERIVELNRGAFLGASPAPEAVRSPDDATVLDVRSADDFAAGHVPGALNVPVAVKGFGTRAGFVLRRDEQVVLHASTPAEADLAARRLRAVGLLELQGYLDGPQELEPLGTVELDDLAALLRGGEVDVIDVRELDERDSGFIPGSKHIPYRLLRAYGAAVAGDKPVVTICESGARAAVAASVLAAAGVDARPVLHGGIPDWHRAGGHTVEFRRCGS